MSWLDALLSERGHDAFLDALCSGLPDEEAQALREERAAILEYEAGIPRVDAERFAGIQAP